MAIGDNFNPDTSIKEEQDERSRLQMELTGIDEKIAHCLDRTRIAAGGDELFDPEPQLDKVSQEISGLAVQRKRIQGRLEELKK